MENLLALLKSAQHPDQVFHSGLTESLEGGEALGGTLPAGARARTGAGLGHLRGVVPLQGELASNQLDFIHAATSFHTALVTPPSQGRASAPCRNA